ncbi:unnamed protein product [Moneuplotes crassus]|uniref:Uncharacterized protein n=1 Tax=Euplotes crassus TaxID=5936 RepID=A0AAD1UE17_EUPCR|nr:unnamed protein product [Moneuplotes crassus]
MKGREVVSNPHCTTTNSSKNTGNPNYVSEPDGQKDQDIIYSKYPLSRSWELISQDLHDTETALVKMKQGIRDLVNSLLRCYRSSIEAEQADFIEMDGTNEQNDKLFNILGFDIMFDEDLQPWLLETNRNPSMVLTSLVLNESGVLTNKDSKVAIEVKANLINEVAKILINKEDSNYFLKCYDNSDPESEDANFIYERVFKIFKHICGAKLKRTVLINDFINYISSLPEELIRSITSDQIITNLNLKEEGEITLTQFFLMLEKFPEFLSVNFLDFLIRIEED